jgi:hypothetical protein
MTDWQFFAELRHLITADPGRRGLDRVAGRSLVSLSAPDLEAACRSLAAARQPSVALVTGFYVARAESYETDGPLGVIALAEVLHHLGVRVTILAEPGCNAVHEVALRLNGLEDDIHLEDLPPVDGDMEAWRVNFWKQHPHLTHLIAIERVGPSHTLESLLRQYGQQPAPLAAFTQEVDAGSWNRPHNMRGYDLAAFTSPAHLLFETLPPGVQSIGIGDGGNEIGMGKIPWDVIRNNVEGGSKIACRIATHHLIVAGTSNWGAYALAAGVAWLKQLSLSQLFDADREAQLWEAVLVKEPLADGITAACQLTVDGLEWNAYRKVMDQLHLWLEQRHPHGVQQFPSVHG